MLLLQLLWSFFQIGLFSIGGGYAAMPLIQQQVTVEHSWLTMTQTCLGIGNSCIGASALSLLSLG